MRHMPEFESRFAGTPKNRDRSHHYSTMKMIAMSYSDIRCV